MKEIFYNPNNLTKDNIDETVIRVKALLINSKKELLLGYSNKTYQFPGGHLEKNESLEVGLKREIQEETGIDIDSNIINKPFAKITYYSQNYRNSNKNRENIIYYYVVNTDKVVNMNNSNLDENEKLGNYVVEKIPLNKVKKVLLDSINDNLINKIIYEEMITVLDCYHSIERS